MTNASLTVRMYHVGFGDCFLVTITEDATVWRMLIDCGVHSLDRNARPIRDTVTHLIADLAAMSRDGVARLDVIAATHRHADHISGFAVDAWEAVTVDEVWLPFTEDESDPDTASLQRRQERCARQLRQLIQERSSATPGDDSPAGTALALTLNSLGNADAMDRLHGRNNKRFANAARRRFLPNKAPANTVIPTGVADAVVHVLGPSRDAAELKRMDPPRSVAWLQLDVDLDPSSNPFPVFADDYVVSDPAQIPEELLRAREATQFTFDQRLLGAASVLESALNNTSLFLVVDVRGVRLIFPGDAQWGAWQHVLANPENRELMQSAALYKIGHHGSHNATPRRFVDEIWQESALAMLPYGRVDRWAATIPKRELLDALHARHHTIIGVDTPEAYPPNTTVHEDRWSEVTFTITGDTGKDR